jgi:hypothetical protein
MTNRDWQRVSQFLAFLLVIIVGAAAAVVLLRSPRPAGPAASPTRIAVSSPGRSPGVSPSAGATASALPSATIEPSAEPSPTEEPSPSPTPSPTLEPSPSLPPTASPSPIEPTAPLRSIRFIGIGFDGEAATTPTPRTVTFRSDGPGTVTARLFKTSEGNVRFCLGQRDANPTCVESDRGTLTGTTEADGKTVWVVTVIGIGPAEPIADLKLQFRTEKPAVTLDGFRFLGVQNSGYNGVDAVFDVPIAEDFRAEGEWDGADRPWRSQLLDVDSGEVIAEASGVGNDFKLETPLGVRTVRFSVINTEEFADQEVFLHAELRWP